MTKHSRQKLNILRTKKASEVKWKVFFIIFKGLSVTENCLRLESASLMKSSEYRSSHQRCSVKKGVLRNFAKFIGKHLHQCLFFNKVTGLRPATLLKKRLWYRCFPVDFATFLRTPFTENVWVNASVNIKDLLKNHY